MTTPNYGWPLIQPTDLVTNLPADFEVFADAVDATVDGIDDRVTDLEVITTEGDLILGDASGDPVRLPIGTLGTVLTSDGDTALWSPAAGAPETAYTLLTSTTTTGASTVTMSFTACSDLLLQVSCVYAAGASLRVRFNGSSSGYDEFFGQLSQSGGGFTPTLNTGGDGFTVTASPNGAAKGFTMLINGAKKVGFPTAFSQGYFVTGGGSPTTRTLSGIHNVNGPITSISLFNNFGDNFTTMNAKVYGRA
jgi:hypothetical protein